MVLLARRRLLLIAILALTGCGGGGSTAPQAPPVTCQGGAATYPLIFDPMTYPVAGSTGVATTIGVITVPPMEHLVGATLELAPPTGGPIVGGTFGVNGAGGLTATIPKLQPNTTYIGGAVGVPCGPDFTFGQFTTGAT